MAFYITGDRHGEWESFSRENFPEQSHMTKDDFIIICGDFGLWTDTPEQNEKLDWLDSQPFTTLFVSGNHENYDLLKTFPISQWCSGQVQKIRPSVIHLIRGQVYEIDGKRFFTMGGARCHDIQDGILEPDDPYLKEKIRVLDRRQALYRVNHISWWKEEMPSQEEYDRALENLEQAGWKVHYILSHCGPSSIVHQLGGGFYKTDPLTDFLEEIAGRCVFDYWFFGHYHDNRCFQNRFFLLYDDILELE